MNTYIDIDIEFPEGFDEIMRKWVAQKCYCEMDVSLADLSEITGVDKEDLSLFFKYRMGMDFISWRNFLRIEEAKRLLIENEELSAQIIGECVGFRDRANFYKQFVKIVGCSPNQWRIANSNPFQF